MKKISSKIGIWLLFSAILATIITFIEYNVRGGAFWKIFIAVQLGTNLITATAAFTGEAIFSRCRLLPFWKAMVYVLPGTLVAVTLTMSICIYVFSLANMFRFKGNFYSLHVFFPAWLITFVITLAAKRLEYLSYREKLTQAELSKLKENEGDHLGEPEMSPGLAVRVQDNYYLVPFSDILYISAHGDKSIIHTNTKDYETKKLLKEIGEKLLSDSFMRIHRGFLVNIKAISHIQYFIGGRYHAYLKDSDDSILPVGRKYAPMLKKKMGIA